MRDIDIVRLATDLHGHLAPGVALGIRMSKIALEKLGMNRGNRKLIAVSETSRCLSDAMQAVTGCTLGHGNAFVENYGKLALSLARVDSGRGIRIALREDTYKLSPIMKKWMLREGRLIHAEEEKLSNDLLNLDEKYLDIDEIEIFLEQRCENSKIFKCETCEDLIPDALTVRENGQIICKQCAGEGYYQVIQPSKTMDLKKPQRFMPKISDL